MVAEIWASVMSSFVDQLVALMVLYAWSLIGCPFALTHNWPIFCLGFSDIRIFILSQSQHLHVQVRSIASHRFNAAVMHGKKVRLYCMYTILYFRDAFHKTTHGAVKRLRVGCSCYDGR